MRRLLVVVGLVAVMGCAGCATPFTVSWEYASEQPEFALLERCFRDELAKAKTTGSADVRNAINRRQAKAMRRLLATVEAGGTPTDRDYRRAGCQEALATTE